MQVQLLRVLQEGEIRRVGAQDTIKVDVRVVAATNRDLKSELAAGRFREDLFFRLQVVTVRVPALKERRADIPLLVKHFIVRHAERLGRVAPRVAPEVLLALDSYEFPGNVRELSHTIERAMLLAREGVITPADSPPELTRSWQTSTSTGTSNLADDWPTLAMLERRYIDRVLLAHRRQQDARRRGSFAHRPANVEPHVRAKARCVAAAGRGSDADVDAELAKMEAEEGAK